MNKFKSKLENHISINQQMKILSRVSNEQMKNLNLIHMNKARYKTKYILCKKLFSSMKTQGKVWIRFFRKDPSKSIK